MRTLLDTDPAYGDLLAASMLLDSGVRIIGERSIAPGVREVVFSGDDALYKVRGSRKQNAVFSHAIGMSAESFTNAKQTYKDWQEVWWREVIQNSIDAGATKIDLRVDEEPGAYRVSCLDNGGGMDRDVILTKFLNIGGTGKIEVQTTGAATLGGFGKAKELIIMPWLAWEVQSRDTLVSGLGGGAGYINPYMADDFERILLSALSDGAPHIPTVDEFAEQLFTERPEYIESHSRGEMRNDVKFLLAHRYTVELCAQHLYSLGLSVTAVDAFISAEKGLSGGAQELAKTLKQEFDNTNSTSPFPYVKTLRGTRVTVWMDKSATNNYTTIGHAIVFLGKCNVPRVRFTANGEVVKANLKAGDTKLRELSVEGVDYRVQPPRDVTLTMSIHRSAKDKDSYYYEMYIRSNGLYMFSANVSTSSRLILEMQGPSYVFMADNRQSFRVSAIDSAINAYLRELAANTQSALRAEKGIREEIHRGSYAQLQDKASFAAELTRNLPATDTAAGGGCRGWKTQKIEHDDVEDAAADKDETEAAQEPDESDAYAEAVEAEPRQLSDELVQQATRVVAEHRATITTTFKEVVENAGYVPPTVTHEDIAALLLQQRFRSAQEVAEVMRTIAHVPDIFVYQNVENFKVPKSFEPGPTMSHKVKHLLRLWCELCRLCMAASGKFHDYGIGWIIDDDSQAACYSNVPDEATGKKRDWLLVNPFKITVDYYSDTVSYKTWFKHGDVASFRRLFGLAVHETTHLLYGVSQHDERFSTALTEHLLFMIDKWTVAKKIRRAVAKQALIEARAVRAERAASGVTRGPGRPRTIGVATIEWLLAELAKELDLPSEEKNDFIVSAKALFEGRFVSRNANDAKTAANELSDMLNALSRVDRYDNLGTYSPPAILTELNNIIYQNCSNYIWRIQRSERRISDRTATLVGQIWEKIAGVTLQLNRILPTSAAQRVPVQRVSAQRPSVPDAALCQKLIDPSTRGRKPEPKDLAQQLYNAGCDRDTALQGLVNRLHLRPGDALHYVDDVFGQEN